MTTWWLRTSIRACDTCAPEFAGCRHVVPNSTFRSRSRPDANATFARQGFPIRCSPGLSGLLFHNDAEAHVVHTLVLPARQPETGGASGNPLR